MADPLRRTILAKLRGRNKANDAREGKERLFPQHTERGYLYQMKGRQRRVNGIRTADRVCAVGRSAVSRCAEAADAHRIVVPAPGGPAGVSVQSEETGMKPFHTRRVRGDSIGFGSCDHVRLKPRREALKAADVRETDTRVLNGTRCAGDYVDVNRDFIQVIESSLEYHGDFSMSALPSPTFFPTELEITATPGLRAPRHHSVDSEEDDYYDNQISPFYESCTQNQNYYSEPASVQTLKLGSKETHRLKTQLKEAYYLLINTMHDIRFEGQAEDRGFVDQASSSSESHESVNSQSTAKHTGSDACLSEERSGQRVFDSGLVLFAFSGHCGVKYKGSLQNISTARAKPMLHRSLSDSGVVYSSEWPSDPQNSEEDPQSLAAGAMMACDVPLGPTHIVSHGLINSPVMPSEVLPTSATPQSCNGMAIMAKHPGVTVNKMQEWMMKGRMLSSEMKERIAGSSLRVAHTMTKSRQKRPSASSHVNGPQHSNNITAAAQQQSVLMECGPESEPSNQDPCTRQTPFNHITVSKKRNWLQQSSTRPLPPSEDVTAPPALQEDYTHPQTHPVSCPSPTRPPHLNIKPGRISHQSPQRPDPAEENDADDEGEIWYNPIPEDEDADLSRCSPTIRVTRTEATGRRASGGAEEGAGGEGGSSEMEQMSVLPSRETSQLHRQMFACKTQEENLTPRATDPLEQPSGGHSPSSSPNPAKRSTALTWSIPDRIRSPRTVRKLSMKMKKLPDLSRKLGVKGNPASSVTASNSKPETGVYGVVELSQSQPSRLSPAGVTGLASGNVIWRYHLDSSVSTQHNFDKRRSNSDGVPKSASKGGYLSDGDSPELVAKSGKHSTSERKNGKTQERDPNGNGGNLKLPRTELDMDAFRSYSFSEQPKCLSHISGLMSLHFYGAEDLKPPRVDSRNVYCAIQVDSVNKARTALLTCRTAFLDMDHTFNIELENAQHLKLVVFSWETTSRRNRVCCHGTVVLPALFRVSKTHQLAVRLEPRGMIYLKLSLMQQRQNSLDGREHEAQVFGVEARRVVEREETGLMVPLLMEKCIAEIEGRGCQVVGLYRLCGSAAVKKELRELFERDSRTVELSENSYPDINVITGVLKDYLRELPHPLISKQLYELVLDSMLKRPLQIGPSGCENDPADSEHAVNLLEVLPEVEKATLRKLLDHLKRVASHHRVNKMTCQNLAVCFGPVLLSQRQEVSCHGNRVFIDSEELASALHFKKHIEVLHYLLQLWPGSTAAVRRRKERPQVLNLSEAEMVGVLRPRAARLDSPSNRYAGDWSGCREPYLQQSCCPDEAHYDDVPCEGPPNVGQEDLQKVNGDVVLEEDSPEANEGTERDEDMQIEKEDSEEDSEGLDRLHLEKSLPISPCDQIRADLEEHRPKEHSYQAYMKIQDFSPALSNRVNLRDLQESIDTLIGNLERELNKNKLNMRY